MDKRQLAPEAVQPARLVTVSVEIQITTKVAQFLHQAEVPSLDPEDVQIQDPVALFANKILWNVEAMLRDRTAFMSPLPVPRISPLGQEEFVPLTIRRARPDNALVGGSFGMELLAKILHHLEYIRLSEELTSSLVLIWEIVALLEGVTIIVGQILVLVPVLILVLLARQKHTCLISTILRELR